MKKLFHFTIVLIGLLYACTNPVKEFDLENLIKSYSKKYPEKSGIDLCRQLSFECDSIYILPPYINKENADLKKLTNYPDIESLVENTSLNDGVSLFLYIKNGGVIKYSVMPRILIDHLPIRPEEFVILNKQSCLLELKR